MKNKLTKQQWIFIILAMITIVISFLAGGYFLGEQSSHSSQKESSQPPIKNDIFTSKMLNDEKTLIASIAWYGYAKHQEPEWYAWKESQSVDHMDLNHMTFKPKLEGNSDNQYYQYQSDKKQQTICGFESSKDHKTYYLYAFKPNQKSDVAPMMVVRRDDLVNDINKNKAKEEILNYSAKLSLSIIHQQKVQKVIEKIQRIKKVPDHSETKNSDMLWSSEQDKALSDAIDQWGANKNATYSEVDITPGENMIPFMGVTLQNKIENSEDALLSINAQFEAVNTSIEKTDDRDYHVLAAYNGTSHNVKNMRYLFVVKDGKPQVLSSNISISIGDPNGKRAANFVPTTDKNLLNKFKAIYYQTSLSSSESSSTVAEEVIEKRTEETTMEEDPLVSNSKEEQEKESNISKASNISKTDTSEEQTTLDNEKVSSKDDNTTVVTEEEVVEETTIDY